MADYNTLEELKEGKKLHPKFLILKSGESLKKGLVPFILEIKSNEDGSKFKINDDDEIECYLDNCYQGPFGGSLGADNMGDLKLECTSGSLLVKFMG